MNFTVNKIDMKFEENGFEENLYGTGCPGISIIATAPDASTQNCYWWYKQTAEKSGIYEFADCAYDGGNPGHVDFKDWLEKVTGCNDDDAIAALTKILKSSDKSNKYSSATSELVEMFNKESTVLVLNSGTQVSNQSAEIYKTAGGKFVGVIFNFNNLHYIVEMTEEEFKKCNTEASEYHSAEYERFCVIYNAIMKEANYED